MFIQCACVLRWLTISQVDGEMSEDNQTAAASGPHTEVNETPGSADSSDANQYNELDTESLDFLDEDLHTNNYLSAVGFIGKSSEIQWLRAAAMAQPERVNEEGRPFIRRRSSAIGNQRVSSFTFWSDNESVDIDFYVDLYEMPRPEIAERLVSIYMAKVHPTFPILDPDVFGDQLRAYFEAARSGNPSRLSTKWQVISNLVFAIGAKHSHLIKEDWRGDENDHITYQARARAFGLNSDEVFNHPDLSQIQGLGLLSFYWLTVGQVSR
jgi:hypothetical protein